MAALGGGLFCGGLLCAGRGKMVPAKRTYPGRTPSRKGSARQNAVTLPLMQGAERLPLKPRTLIPRGEAPGKLPPAQARPAQIRKTPSTPVRKSPAFRAGKTEVTFPAHEHVFTLA